MFCSPRWVMRFDCHPYFNHSCQLYIRLSKKKTPPHSSPSPLLSFLLFFLPVICILSSAHSISIFYHVCHILCVLFPVSFCLISSFCSVCQSALLAPLLFVFVINCCLQGAELGLSLHRGKCVLFFVFFLCVYESCASTVEVIPQKVSVLYYNTSTPTKIPLTHVCCVQGGS